MSNHSHLFSTDRINNKAQNDSNNYSCPPSSQQPVRFSSSRPALVETWLESVRSNCPSTGTQNNDRLATPPDKPRPSRPSCPPCPDKLDQRLPETHTPVCSPGLFIPASSSRQDNLDSANAQILEESDLDLLPKSARFGFQRSRNFFDPVTGPEKRNACEEFQRQPRRKTRESRYDTKHTTMEDQEYTDRSASRRDNHRMRQRRRLRSGKEVMKNFASDVVKKERVITRPHVAEDLLSEDRHWNSNTLADLSFNNFDLGLSKTKLRTFGATDIDSTSRRSNILPESNVLSPMGRTHQEHADDGLNVNPEGFLNRLSNTGELPKANEVDMESAANFIGTVPLMLDNQTVQDSDSFLWHKYQHRPIIRAKNPRQAKFYHSPSMNGPGQLESRHPSPQYVNNQGINEILQPGILDETYIPHLRSWEVSRDTLCQPPYREDTAEYDASVSPRDGLIVAEPVSPQLRLQRPHQTGHVTVHQSPQLPSVIYQPPLTKTGVGLDRRSSRHLAYEDSQASVPLFQTIPVSPTSWAESVFPCIGRTRGETCCDLGPRTKAQSLMKQPLKLHGSGNPETIKDQGMSPYDSDSEWTRDRASDRLSLTRRRSQDPNSLHDSCAQPLDEAFHVFQSTKDSHLLDGMQVRGVGKYPDNESWGDLDIQRQGSGMQRGKFAPSREKIDDSTLDETHELPYSSAFKLF